MDSAVENIGLRKKTGGRVGMVREHKLPAFQVIKRASVTLGCVRRKLYHFCYLEPIQLILEQCGCGFMLISDIGYAIKSSYRINPYQSGVHNRFPVVLARVHKEMYALFMLSFGIMPPVGEQMIPDRELSPGKEER